MGNLTKVKKFLKHTLNIFGVVACLLIFGTFLLRFPQTVSNITSPLWGGKISNNEAKADQYEVFGFAPYWNLSKLDNVDFNTLTTLAYFGVPINADGGLAKDDIGYQRLQSSDADALFAKAKSYGTKVVLTVTIMDPGTVMSVVGDKAAQQKAIKEISEVVKEKNMDGVNIDIEYIPDPGNEKRQQFSNFVSDMRNYFHSQNPNSYVTVSVLASSAKSPKLYDIGSLGRVSDGVFMMAYDFATTSSNKAMPTDPLYGYKEGKYWYDVSTAVEDFTRLMPANKLILGLPWYGYDYPVNNPEVNAPRGGGYSYWYKHWTSRYYYVWRLASYSPPSFVQTYTKGTKEVTATLTGWDNYGQVGWKAYKDGNTWRMYFLEDSKSLGIKYDFAKQKNLGGVGIWALGFDEGSNDMWHLLSEKFGTKLADANLPK